MLGLMLWLASMATGDPPSDGCMVEVVGMPVSVMHHHYLVVGKDEEHPVTTTIALRLSEGSTQLRVRGPRYHGQRGLDAAQCSGGARVEIQVDPLPARVAFPCAPVGMTVECSGCPDEVEPRVYLAEEFPPVPMSSFSREIEVLLRAPGFRHESRTIQLYPGPNSVQVQLEPLARPR